MENESIYTIFIHKILIIVTYDNVLLVILGCPYWTETVAQRYPSILHGDWPQNSSNRIRASSSSPHLMISSLEAAECQLGLVNLMHSGPFNSPNVLKTFLQGGAKMPKMCSKSKNRKNQPISLKTDFRSDRLFLSISNWKHFFGLLAQPPFHPTNLAFLYPY